jgi:hypothetical protein
MSYCCYRRRADHKCSTCRNTTTSETISAEHFGLSSRLLGIHCIRSSYLWLGQHGMLSSGSRLIHYLEEN